jgi:hypothetical protein
MGLGPGFRDPGSGIRDPGSEIQDPGSGINLFRIPDPGPGVKKAPDPGFRNRNTGCRRTFICYTHIADVLDGGGEGRLEIGDWRMESNKKDSNKSFCLF